MAEMTVTAHRTEGLLVLMLNERAEMLAALRDAEVALQHSVPRCDHYPEPQSRHFSTLLRVRRAVALAD